MTHVLVLYNQPLLPPDHPETDSETEVLFTVEQVASSLETSGFAVSRAAVGRDPNVVANHVRRLGPDVVFNLFEGIPPSDDGDHGDTEACVVGLLDWLGVPCTGSSARTLALARDKPTSKLLLRGAGLPTPGFLSVTSADDPRLNDPALRWPVIVKLADQDASVGIDQGSVVTDSRGLRQRVAQLTARFPGAILVEEYIAGRELTVGVVEVPALGGVRSLPPSEFEFDVPDGEWPIVTYDAKWKVRSADYERTPYREVACVDDLLAQRLGELAMNCYRVMELRDYGRVDFRVTARGEPFVLEVNPNPDLSPTAGFAGVLNAVGLSYADLVVGLVERAVNRRQGEGVTR